MSSELKPCKGDTNPLRNVRGFVLAGLLRFVGRCSQGPTLGFHMTPLQGLRTGASSS